MKRKPLQRGVRLHKTVSQHPLVFPPGATKAWYDVSKKGRVVYGNEEWGFRKGYRGRVIETDSGIYCAGYNIDERFKRLPIMEAVKWNEDLPTAFDYKFLIKLLYYAHGKKVVRFKSQYQLLKTLSIPLNDRNYNRVVTSLLKWNFIVFHFAGRFTWKAKQKKNEDSFKYFKVIRSFDIPVDSNDQVQIRFSSDFMELLGGKYATFLNLPTVEALRSETALNLHQYLSSFNRLLDGGRELTRNIKEFSRMMFSSESRPYRLRGQIGKAITEINKASRGVSFQVSFDEEKGLVSFSKRNE